ncbi:hypothetical protein [Amycolatopsis thermophila]|uniref:Glyoxalase-like domain-containing protein n=1 Tax=Amycolatopsis thermophila TaxID=206084 RepID=A0ABU0ENX0_9PSEU|nr:hypothetical protein [Amycolatopsis thermophila]MDQ0376993.1 hypothetical protein [Amycolatopsis thermophila]
MYRPGDEDGDDGRLVLHTADGLPQLAVQHARPWEPLSVYADPAGHPFCISVA